MQLPKVEISKFPKLLKAATAVGGFINGQPNGRIINGQPANENQIPHQCSILSPIGGAFAVCGGSIISTSWVMTGMHQNFEKSIFISNAAIIISAHSCPLYSRIFSA